MGAAAATLKILYAEGDADVFATHASALSKAGHSVQQALGRPGAEEALRRGSFDLLVLGPTLSRDDRHHLPYAAKKANPHISVLAMHADGSRHPNVDAFTDTGATVETVLARIEGMTIGGTAGQSAAAAAGR
jgi:DNA-binding NtrC family response regulator